MLTDVIFEDDRWKAQTLEPMAEAAASATLRHLGLDPEGYEIAVLACDDTRIAVLNGDFRDKPRATNVLSWPEEDLSAEEDGATPEPAEDGDPDDPHHLGDIALSYETCLREAQEQDKQASAHVTHLIVHGVLHLLGYDHIRDGDATLMEGIEIKVLDSLGLPDPYTT